MRNFTIFTRLGLGYLVIIAALIALGVYATLEFDRLNQITRSVSTVDNETIRVANRLRDAVYTLKGFEKKYVVSKDKDFKRQLVETESFIEKDLQQINRVINTPDQKRRIERTKDFYNRYLALVQEEERLIKSHTGYSQEAYERRKEDLTDRLFHELDEVSARARTEIDRKKEIAEKIGSEATRVAVLITIASVITAVLIAFFNARTINRPIVLLIKETREIALGRFGKHLTIKSPPEINELANAFNHMCDRLKEIDEMKADLISHVSHEFRTPLAVIREAASLSLDCISTESTEKQRRLLEIVAEECERLINSVNMILNSSRMDAGMVDYHMEKLGLSRLIELSVAKIRPIAERKRISLELEMTDSLPCATIDPEKIAQVFDNLLDNALKFTPDGGRISIGASVKDRWSLEHFPGKSNEFIEISVADTGCGIPEENMQIIFDKYKRLQGKGTGLGLYIAKQIVAAHGGNIWVKRETQQGSTFSFTVPVFH